MSTVEWSRLMNAPWGKFDNNSIQLKEEAFTTYKTETYKFWERKCECAFEQEIHKRKDCKAPMKAKR